MSMFPQQRAVRLEYGTDDRAIFNFFNAVYAWMAVGLAVTAAVAWACSQSAVMMNVVYGSRGGYMIMGLAAFAIAMGVQSMAMRISAAAGTALFLLYAAVIGALISGIFRIYSGPTLLASFAMTGGVFGGMSVYGYITKRDLTKIGSILVMCVWG